MEPVAQATADAAAAAKATVDTAAPTQHPAGWEDLPDVIWKEIVERAVLPDLWTLSCTNTRLRTWAQAKLKSLPRIVVVGGSGAALNDYTKDVRVLCLATLRWEELPPLPFSRARHACCSMADKLVVTGGVGEGPGPQGRARPCLGFKFDTCFLRSGADDWTEDEGALGLPFPTQSTQAVELQLHTRGMPPHGMLVLGGDQKKGGDSGGTTHDVSIIVFDEVDATRRPATKQGSFDFGEWTLLKRREAFGLATMPDGRVCIAGGREYSIDDGGSDDDGAGSLSTAHVYSTAAKRWEVLPAMPREHSAGTRAVALGGSLVVLGGGHGNESPAATEEQTEALQKHVKAAQGMEEFASQRLQQLLASGADHSKAHSSLCNAKRFLADLETQLATALEMKGADGSTYLAHKHAVDSYSFRTQQWTQLPDTLDPRSFHGAEAVCGAIIVLGGMYNDPGSLELWDGARWRRMKLSLPTQLQFFGTALLHPAVSPSSAAAAGGSANLNPI